ncbi:MAG: pyridoxamine 5'-phosphate oxidase family protein [Gammaproteobacteria bacterium]|nr:pyridoxamine 5'-phosphate oxidase family protein [Gammaproteobacteria bacterium]
MVTVKENHDLVAVEQELTALRHRFHTLLLATVNDDGTPEATSAPYLEEGAYFYLFVSELAPHTRNLLNRHQASVLFIENEDEASNPFARKRLSYQCHAKEIPANDPDYGVILDKMEQQFGKLLQTLRQLQDFHLLQLQPQQGHYVAGFGRAFTIDCSAQGRLSHLSRPEEKR